MSCKKLMKFVYNVNLPQKSIFGFKVLSSLNSSIASYFLLVTGKLVNPLFGFNQTQIIAGSLFNIVLNLSILILVLNLFIKRKQIQRIHFLFLNSILFFYLPFSFYIIGKNIENLFLYI